MIDYANIWTKEDIKIFKEQNNKVIDLLVDNSIIIHPLESKIKSIVEKQNIKKCNLEKKT